MIEKTCQTESSVDDTKDEERCQLAAPAEWNVDIRRRHEIQSLSVLVESAGKSQVQGPLLVQGGFARNHGDRRFMLCLPVPSPITATGTMWFSRDS